MHYLHKEFILGIEPEVDIVAYVEALRDVRDTMQRDWVPGWMVGDAQGQLARILKEIEHNDRNYDVRYGLVLRAVTIAHQLGYAAGLRVDSDNPTWPVAYIELPDVGQVSWHMLQHRRAWDGHTTEEKYQRVRAFYENVQNGVAP